MLFISLYFFIPIFFYYRISSNNSDDENTYFFHTSPTGFLTNFTTFEQYFLDEIPVLLLYPAFLLSSRLSLRNITRQVRVLLL